MSDFRQKCIGRTQVTGTFAAIPHPVAIEILAQCGPDFLCIDWEHAQIARDSIENLIRAADVHRMPVMVRVPGHAPEPIAAVLDSGAVGVLVPRVSTAHEAQMAVKASRYPPIGQRGVGPGRAAGYGYRIPDYLARANAEVLIAVQVETADGLANIDAIAETEGVDMIFVGPGDLSVSLSAIGSAGAAHLEAAIRRIIETAIANGKIAGIFCNVPQDVARWSAIGASCFIVSSDTTFLRASTSAAMATARAT